MRFFRLVCFLFFLVFYFKAARSECETCGKAKNNRQNVISSYPHVIHKSGRYRLDRNIFLSPKDANEAPIIIKADNVTLDLGGYSLDMRKSGKTGILVNGVKNIRIFNGKILHTGSPSDVRTLLSIGDFKHETPFVGHSIRGVGIALNEGSEKIHIENVIFEENFIGIGSLDKVKQVFIKNCRGIECGLKLSNKTLGHSTRHGGFIVIAPTLPTTDFLCEDIHISNCIAYSESAEFGIAIFNGKNVFVQDCTVHYHPKSNGGAITAMDCQEVHFNNLLGHGSTEAIKTIRCENVNIFNCESLE